MSEVGENTMKFSSVIRPSQAPFHDPTALDSQPAENDVGGGVTPLFVKRSGNLSRRRGSVLLPAGKALKFAFNARLNDC